MKNKMDVAQTKNFKKTGLILLGLCILMMAVPYAIAGEPSAEVAAITGQQPVKTAAAQPAAATTSNAAPQAATTTNFLQGQTLSASSVSNSNAAATQTTTTAKSSQSQTVSSNSQPPKDTTSQDNIVGVQAPVSGAGVAVVTTNDPHVSAQAVHIDVGQGHTASEAHQIEQWLEAARLKLEQNGLTVHMPSNIYLVTDSEGGRMRDGNWYLNEVSAEIIRNKIVQTSLIGEYPNLSYYQVEGFSMYVTELLFGISNTSDGNSHQWNPQYAYNNGNDIGAAGASGNTTRYQELMNGCGNNAQAIAQSLRDMATAINNPARTIALIRNALSRLGTSGGNMLSALVNSTGNNTERTAILNAFAGHNIHENTAGLTSSNTQTSSATQASSVSNQTTAITAMYQNYLGRAPEAGAVQYWINSGWSLEVIKKSILMSPERQANITAMYQTYLGRTPAAGETQYWATSGLSLGEMKQLIAKSPEALARQAAAKNKSR